MKYMMVMFILTLLVSVSSVRAEIFRDDFNDGDLKGWTFIQGAEHGRIQNSALVLSSPNPKAGFWAEAIIVVDGIIASDYEVAVSVKISRLVKGILRGPHIGLRAHAPPFIENFQGNKVLRTLLYERSYHFTLGHQDIRWWILQKEVLERAFNMWRFLRKETDGISIARADRAHFDYLISGCTSGIA